MPRVWSGGAFHTAQNLNGVWAPYASLWACAFVSLSCSLWSFSRRARRPDRPSRSTCSPTSSQAPSSTALRSCSSPQAPRARVAEREPPHLQRARGVLRCGELSPRPPRFGLRQRRRWSVHGARTPPASSERNGRCARRKVELDRGARQHARDHWVGCGLHLGDVPGTGRLFGLHRVCTRSLRG